MNVSNAITVVRQTHVGLLREHNEDAVASDLSIGLLLLADGMGGYKAGEVASEIAVLMIAAEVTEAMQHPARYHQALPRRLPESKMMTDAVKKPTRLFIKYRKMSRNVLAWAPPWWLRFLPIIN